MLGERTRWTSLATKARGERKREGVGEGERDLLLICEWVMSRKIRRQQVHQRNDQERVNMLQTGREGDKSGAGGSPATSFGQRVPLVGRWADQIGEGGVRSDGALHGIGDVGNLVAWRPRRTGPVRQVRMDVYIRGGAVRRD